MTGCASAPQPRIDSSTTPNAADSALAVSQVDYEEPVAAELLQPPTVVESIEGDVRSVALRQFLQTGELTMEALEQLALANSPAISQSAARVRALRGKWVQVGLAPNPTVGYVAGELGNEGTAGQQGGFIVSTMGLKPSPSGETFRFYISVTMFGMENYRTGSHSRFNIKYHFVWVTKYRRPILTGAVGIRLRELVREVCQTHEIEILQGAVSSDHVHILVSSPPTLSPSKIMQ